MELSELIEIRPTVVTAASLVNELCVAVTPTGYRFEIEGTTTTRDLGALLIAQGNNYV